MTASNLRANQQAIGDFNELLDEGGHRLQEFSRSVLLEGSQVVEPLHYITKGTSIITSVKSLGMLMCDRITLPNHST